MTLVAHSPAHIDLEECPISGTQTFRAQTESFMSRLRKSSLLLGLLCVVFAALQYNDPDPEIWISVYGYAAGVCFFSAWGIRSWWGVGVGLLACGVGFWFTFPGFLELLRYHELGDIGATMSPERPYIELSREFLGLLIVSIIFLCEGLAVGRRSEAQSAPRSAG